MSAQGAPEAASLVDALRRRFGERCRVRRHELRVYGYDAMGTAFGLPAAVVQVESAEEVAALLQIVRAAGGALVARGSGTGLSGGSVPVPGAVVLSFERMRGVGPLQGARRRLRVEPGVINGALEGTLAPHGLFYPPDPASYRVSTIGGNIAENAGGPHAAKYGVTGQHVEALRVVDAQGLEGWMHAGAAQPGPDLVALVVGSEGTLALVTEAELRLGPRPADVATMLLSFRDIAGATDYVSAIVAAGMVPATLEFLDRNSIETIEAWGVTHYPPGSGAVLLVEFDGDPEEVREGVRRAREIGERIGAIDVQVARDQGERDALWLGRRGSYAATARHGRRVFTQDITVPRDRLTEMLAEVSKIAAAHGLMVATKGHAGDGNLHPDFPYDPADPDQSARVHAANEEVMQACVALGGSITGEHGVGTEKLHGMPIMFGAEELGLMRAVRAALDPEGVLNPGKAVPDAVRVRPAAAVEPSALPRSAAEVQAAVLAARAEGGPLRISLRHLRGIRLSLANMTAEVGAGEEIAALQAALLGGPLGFAPNPLRARTFAELLLHNDYGPEHLGAGTLRRCLLAVTYVTGAGEIVRMGRGVVKNVAGYDLYRLLIGSRGRLGVPVSLTVRLGPPAQSPWWRRRGALRHEVEAAGAQALFALPQDEGVTLYAQSPVAPGALWQPAPEVPEVLAAAQRDLEDGEELFDVAAGPERIGEILAALPAAPRIMLSAAGRVLARAPRATAQRVAGQLAARDGRLRADYGPEHAPLAQVPGIAGAWEEKLQRVFDPDRVLAAWNLGGEQA